MEQCESSSSQAKLIPDLRRVGQADVALPDALQPRIAAQGRNAVLIDIERSHRLEPGVLNADVHTACAREEA